MWTELWQFFPGNDSSIGLEQPIQLNLHNPRDFKVIR